MQKPTTTSALIRQCGGQEAAAKAIREHTRSVFGAQLSDEDIGLLRQMQNELRSAAASAPLCAFQPDEVRQYVQDKVHVRKTAGMLGVSAELIRALSLTELGMDFLTGHCNLMLRDKILPQSYLRACMCLIPKDPAHAI